MRDLDGALLIADSLPAVQEWAIRATTIKLLAPRVQDAAAEDATAEDSTAELSKKGGRYGGITLHSHYYGRYGGTSHCTYEAMTNLVLNTI